MNSLANTGTLGNPPVSEDVKTSSQETDSELWTTERVAKYLHVSLKTVFNLRKKGLPYVQLGGAVRFVPQEIRDYLVKTDAYFDDPAGKLDPAPRETVWPSPWPAAGLPASRSGLRGVGAEPSSGAFVPIS